jgi:hypothetical protein
MVQVERRRRVYDLVLARGPEYQALGWHSTDLKSRQEKEASEV